MARILNIRKNFMLLDYGDSGFIVDLVKNYVSEVSPYRPSIFQITDREIARVNRMFKGIDLSFMYMNSYDFMFRTEHLIAERYKKAEKLVDAYVNLRPIPDTKMEYIKFNYNEWRYKNGITFKDIRRK